MPAKRVCTHPGCPVLTAGGRCPAHRSERNRRLDLERGSPAARGYGKAHRELRSQLQPIVDRGDGRCWRCGTRIPPGASWHLGHDDHDRTRYRGIECPHCNLSAAGRAAHRT